VQACTGEPAHFGVRRSEPANAEDNALWHQARHRSPDTTSQPWASVALAAPTCRQDAHGQELQAHQPPRCSRPARATGPNPSVNATPTSYAPGPRSRQGISSASLPWRSAGGRALPQTLGLRSTRSPRLVAPPERPHVFGLQLVSRQMNSRIPAQARARARAERFGSVAQDETRSQGVGGTSRRGAVATARSSDRRAQRELPLTSEAITPLFGKCLATRSLVVPGSSCVWCVTERRAWLLSSRGVHGRHRVRGLTLRSTRPVPAGVLGREAAQHYHRPRAPSHPPARARYLKR
jgi:hypothetical protein